MSRLAEKNRGCQAARRLACLRPCADMMLPASNLRSSPPSRLGSAGRTLLPCTHMACMAGHSQHHLPYFGFGVHADRGCQAAGHITGVLSLLGSLFIAVIA